MDTAQPCPPARPPTSQPPRRYTYAPAHGAHLVLRIQVRLRLDQELRHTLGIVLGGAHQRRLAILRAQWRQSWWRCVGVSVRRASAVCLRAPLVDAALGSNAPPTPSHRVRSLEISTSRDERRETSDVIRESCAQHGHFKDSRSSERQTRNSCLARRPRSRRRGSSAVFACSPAPQLKRITPSASEHLHQHWLSLSKLRAQREVRVTESARL